MIRVGDVVRYSDDAHKMLGSLVDYELYIVKHEEHDYLLDEYGVRSLYQYIEFADGTGCDAAWVEVVKRANIFKRILAYLKKKT